MSDTAADLQLEVDLCKQLKLPPLENINKTQTGMIFIPESTKLL